MHLRSAFYLEALGAQLPRLGEGGALAAVLEHCMYCGMSLGRVGLDFRGLAAPLFETQILRLFRQAVQASGLSRLRLCSLCAPTVGAQTVRPVCAFSLPDTPLALGKQRFRQVNCAEIMSLC